MKVMRYAVFGLALTLASPGIASGPAADPLVGTWAIESVVDTPEGEAPTYPFGKQPKGYFIFTSGGRFSFSVMGERPAEDVLRSIPRPEDEWVPRWYVSYFGTYRYDPEGPSWVSTVEGGNIPGYVGTDQRRSFKLDGKVMTITGYGSANGKPVKAVRVLRKVEG